MDLINQIKGNIKVKEQEHKKAVETAAVLSGSLKEKGIQIPDQYKIQDSDKKIEHEIQLSNEKLNNLNDAWNRADKIYRDLEKQISAKKSTLEAIKESYDKAIELTKNHIEPDIFLLQKRSDESDNLWKEHNKKIAELNAQSERLQMTLQTLNKINKDTKTIN